MYNKILFIFLKNIFKIKNLIEFNIVSILVDDSVDREREKYLEMGMDIPEDKSQEEKIVKYAFDCSKIVEVRQTFVRYKGEFLPAVVATYSKDLLYTPPLLTTFEEFKNKVNEHNKQNTKTE